MAVGLLLLLSGCAASDPAPPLRTDGHISKTEGRAYAEAVNIGVADAPGMTSVSLEHDLRSGTSVASRCQSTPAARRPVLRRRSPRFVRHDRPTGAQEVLSSVTVWRTSALASAALASGLNAKFQACALRVYERELVEFSTRATAAEGGDPARLRLGKLAASPLPAGGWPGAIPRSRLQGERLTLPGSYAGRPVQRLYVDILVFVVGPAEVRLVCKGIPKPVSASVEHRLATVLIERAKA